MEPHPKETISSTHILKRWEGPSSQSFCEWLEKILGGKSYWSGAIKKVSRERYRKFTVMLSNGKHAFFDRISSNVQKDIQILRKNLNALTGCSLCTLLSLWDASTVCNAGPHLKKEDCRYVGILNGNLQKIIMRKTAARKAARRRKQSKR